MTPDGSSFHIIPEDTAQTVDLLSAVLQTACDLTISLRRDGLIKAVIVNQNSNISHDLYTWVGQHVHAVLTSESCEKIDRVLSSVDTDAPTAALAQPPMELNHSDSTGWQRSLRYNFVHVGDDGSLLMLGSDLEAIATAQQALVRTQAALEHDSRTYRERNALFSLLKSESREATAFVSAKSGRIIDVTGRFADLIETSPDTATGKRLSSFLAADSAKQLDEVVFGLNQTSPPRLHISLSNGTENEMIIERVRTAKETVLICRLDAGPYGTPKSMLWQNFSDHTPDGIVFVDENGRVEALNPTFFDFTEKPEIDAILGEPIAEFLGRGSVDWTVLKDNAKQNGTLRHYLAEVKSHFGAAIPVSISMTVFKDGGVSKYGMTLRELSSDTLGDDRNFQDAENVAELVGKVPLKDIVAQTTDIIEKICIETAIKITKNNRFAAAEMLNLSRQSLYVKLRKFGLIDKPED
ncbi:MAG: transcriptional regulator PpsR [Pseudomonadota bacterium]